MRGLSDNAMQYGSVESVRPRIGNNSIRGLCDAPYLGLWAAGKR
jgi:hypothetical protein